jgi:hypothetical protein
MPFPPGRARFLASAAGFSPGSQMHLIIRYFGGLGGELKGETIPFGEQVLS